MQTAKGSRMRGQDDKHVRLSIPSLNPSKYPVVRVQTFFYFFLDLVEDLYINTRIMLIPV